MLGNYYRVVVFSVYLSSFVGSSLVSKGLRVRYWLLSLAIIQMIGLWQQYISYLDLFEVTNFENEEDFKLSVLSFRMYMYFVVPNVTILLLHIPALLSRLLFKQKTLTKLIEELKELEAEWKYKTNWVFLALLSVPSWLIIILNEDVKKNNPAIIIGWLGRQMVLYQYQTFLWVLRHAFKSTTEYLHDATDPLDSACRHLKLLDLSDVVFEYYAPFQIISLLLAISLVTQSIIVVLLEDNTPVYYLLMFFEMFGNIIIASYRIYLCLSLTEESKKFYREVIRIISTNSAPIRASIIGVEPAQLSYKHTWMRMYLYSWKERTSAQQCYGYLLINKPCILTIMGYIILCTSLIKTTIDSTDENAYF